MELVSLRIVLLMVAVLASLRGLVSPKLETRRFEETVLESLQMEVTASQTLERMG